MRGKWERRNVFIAHWSLGKKKKKKKEELGAVHQQDLSLMEKVIIASNFHARRTYNAICIGDCKKVLVLEWSLLMWLSHLSCLRWSGCAMLDLSHVCYILRLSSHLVRKAACHAQGVAKGQKVCIAIEQLLAGWLCHNVVGHHFRCILSGWLEGSVLFYRLWLASAGKWQTHAAPPNHFQLCSGNQVLCVCVFVHKPCISIPYLSLLMSRELWQRPSVAFCL